MGIQERHHILGRRRLRTKSKIDKLEMEFIDFDDSLLCRRGYFDRTLGCLLTIGLPVLMSVFGFGLLTGGGGGGAGCVGLPSEALSLVAIGFSKICDIGPNNKM